jgi:hypothetical protein
LNVVIASSDVVNTGVLTISVVIPGTGGEESGSLPLTIASNPIPLISNLMPGRVAAGYQLPVKLIINGSFFAPDSMVQINGNSRPTTFVSSNQLTAVLPSSDFIASALPTITVVSPTAGATTNSATLAIFRYGDMTFDNAVTVVDLVSLANFLAGNITPIDPAPGDLNLDGMTTVVDLVTLANFLAGNIHQLPVIADQTAFLFNAGAIVHYNPLMFAGQAVGTTSDPLPVTLTNGGPSTTLSVNITVTGSFNQTNNCSSSLPPNQSCIINLIFAPTAAGPAAGTLTVSDSAFSSPPTASINGLGIASTQPPAPPTAALSTSGAVSDSVPTLTFTRQGLGTDSSAQPLTLTNEGPTALSVSGINISPSSDFAESDNCGSSLAPQASCTINVTFSPATTGTRTATLTVTDNASNSPHMVNLSGSGGSNLPGDGPPRDLPPLINN